MLLALHQAAVFSHDGVANAARASSQNLDQRLLGVV